jgi:Protein of unknown function (DUF2948)
MNQLRLRAEDSEDLRIIAAVLQDALVAMTDMEFLAGEHCFALVANRFRWENCDVAEAEAPQNEQPAEPPKEYEDIAFAPCRSYERVNCGIRFDGVGSVRCKGIDRNDRGRILELLTIQVEQGAVLLLFAGGSAVRLEGDGITCHLHDLGDPWPTTWRPRHPISDTA